MIDRKKLFIASFIFIAVFGFLVAADGAQAALVTCGRQSGTAAEQVPCTACDIFVLAKNVIDFIMLKLAPAVATLIFLWAGFLIILGGADPGQVKRGKEIFWLAVKGLFIIFGAWLVANTLIKSLAVNDVAKEWYKIECKAPVIVPPAVPPPISPKGTCTGIQCSDSNLNVCGDDASASCSQNAVNYWNAEIQRGAQGKQICGGIDTVAMVKAIISQESGGNTSATSGKGSYGIVQLKPDTANQFKSGCTTDNIDTNWLTNPRNVAASVCIAVNYMKSLAGPCGCDVRQIAAGYNGGGGSQGACDLSQSCASCSICGAGQTRRWECLWDGPDGGHKTCNVDRANGSFNETRKYAPKVSYCYKQF